jgi:hypothetical protein
MIKGIMKFLLLLLIYTNNLKSQPLPDILYIGDSHSFGQFGKVMDETLSQVSEHLVIESSCGSTPSTWLGTNTYQKTVCGFWKKDGLEELRTKVHSTPNFIEEIENYRPDIVIVQLGTNIAAFENPLGQTKSIDKMMKTIINKNITCYWIGPPDANSPIVTKKKLIITNDLLKKLAKNNNCTFIDSLRLTSFPLNYKEGIHYPSNLSRTWGEKVSKILLKLLP